MTISAIFTDNSFKVDAFTDFLTSLSVMSRGLSSRQINTIKSEDDETALKVKSKFEFDDDPPPRYPVDTIADNLNTEPENIDQKIKQDDGEVVEH